ncbi:Protein of uncharacterised function (DUF3237) [Staphylococcus gallinarum]|uniref:Protein of uncharacterized function (DUF3237) n=1 Tax=Staphylococcus gallinarum TaxID=1293 RepID=A0A380FB07_STAGA|nr:Protein of uncharacterised function (DUF3237) [Staphylococcus gallinarum]
MMVRQFILKNNGIRTVPESYKESVINGGFVDSEVYYFRTTPTFETYNTSYKWANGKDICRLCD